MVLVRRAHAGRAFSRNMGGPREADERQQLAAVEAARARLRQAEAAKRAADAVRPMCAALAQ